MLIVTIPLSGQGTDVWLTSPSFCNKASERVYITLKVRNTTNRAVAPPCTFSQLETRVHEVTAVLAAKMQNARL
jgi:hypothetical protein